MTILACINIYSTHSTFCHYLKVISTLTVRLRGAGLRGGELPVPGGGVGQHLDAVVGEGQEALQRRARPDHRAQARRVQPRLAWLVSRGERDEEDAVSLDLAVPGLVGRSSPLEMEPDRG